MMPAAKIRNPPVFRQDFSLSETEYLNEVQLPLGEGVSAAADLYCRDYAGKCKAYVELFGEGDTYLKRDLIIPRDDDSDGMADCWEETAKGQWEAVHGTVETSALDFITRFLPTEPRDPDGAGRLAAHLTEGDGLPPFDEYRGFSLPGVSSTGGRPHLRLSPARKEMIFQVDVASTNNIAVVTAEEARALVADVADVFLRDLGIRLEWYVVEPHDRMFYSENSAEAMLSKYNDGLGPSAPPLHSRKGVRRFVLSTSLPDSTEHGDILGIGNPGAALMDVGEVRGSFLPGDPLREFLVRNAVTPHEALLRLSLHESGHVAGCRGDIRIPEPEVAFQVRSRLGGNGDCELSLRQEAGRRLLVLRDPSGLTYPFPLYGWELVTVGGLVSAVNGSELFRAAAPQEALGADAARLVFLRKGENKVKFKADTNLWHNVSLEAALNGVMSYNRRHPAAWKSPAFDNAAAAEEDGPLKVLFEIEVGSVNILPISGGYP